MNLQGNKTVFTSFRVEECNLILRSENEVLLRQLMMDFKEDVKSSNTYF